MPFALVLIGIILVVTGAKDTHVQLGQQLQKDFTGDGNFVFWVAAVGSVGALGYIEPLRPLSRAFMVLIIVAVLIANPKFFTELSSALKEGPIAPTKSANAGNTSSTMADVTKTEEVAKEQHDKAMENAGKVFKLFLNLFGGGPAF
jgi:hypothetical protein